MPETHAESTKSTTSNGFEISYPREILLAGEFRDVIADYGLSGKNPGERLTQLKALSVDRVAIMIADINRRTQGSEETIVNGRVMEIGPNSTVPPESRYDLFVGLVEKIAQTPDNVNPARVGDSLALGVVLLHPFEDGNGRTARLLGLVFRDDFDDPDYESTFGLLAESRDEVRARNEHIVGSYIPYFENQNDPTQVMNYFNHILTTDNSRMYTGPYMQAPLTIEQVQ